MSGDSPNAGPPRIADPVEDPVESPVTPERDLAGVPATEVIGRVALHLMTAAAVKVGLGDDRVEAAADVDLDEARALITALAGLVTGAAPHLGHHHAAPLRDGLRSLQLAFREASVVPDAPGEGPGEQFTGPVRR